MPMARFPLTSCAVRGAEESPGQPLSKALLGDAKAVGPNLKNHEIIGSFAQVWECVAESEVPPSRCCLPQAWPQQRWRTMRTTLPK